MNIILIFFILTNTNLKYANSFAINSNHILYTNLNYRNNNAFGLRCDMNFINHNKINSIDNDVNEFKIISKNECNIIFKTWKSFRTNLKIDYPNFLYKSHLSFINYISTNRSSSDIYLTWSPYFFDIVYLIAAKIDHTNKIFYVNRLALSPAFINKGVWSYDLKLAFERELHKTNLKSIDYTILFSSDPRYKLEWDMKKL